MISEMDWRVSAWAVEVYSSRGRVRGWPFSSRRWTEFWSTCVILYSFSPMRTTSPGVGSWGLISLFSIRLFICLVIFYHIFLFFSNKQRARVGGKEFKFVLEWYD